MEKPFEIFSLPFNNQVEQELRRDYVRYLNWPLVYILRNDEKQCAYVGETTDVVTRMCTHYKSESKKDLEAVNIVISDYFNKSATLDVESNLIRYMSADGQYQLLNANLGIANHRYYNQREVYWQLFKDIWNELRTLGIARHSLEHIDNSDLFKYSPYKSLTKEQISGLKLIIDCILNDDAKISLIKGGAGTGKSILAIFLFKLLLTDLSDFNYADFDDDDLEIFEKVRQIKDRYRDLKMALVIPMSSFRATIANVFRKVKGLSHKMVIGPSELVGNHYDIVIVDEGHRLRRRVNLGSYFGTFDKCCEHLGLDKHLASELDWVEQTSKKAIIFYDEAQSVKPSDVTRDRFRQLERKESTRIEQLRSQLRVKGGNRYVNFINRLFSPHGEEGSRILPQSFDEYDFFLYDDLAEMVEDIRAMDKHEGLSRMIAGYAWPWVSKKDPDKYDIEIGDIKLKWNSEATDWINSPNSTDEVGCIHTTHGYDLNYSGIIIGPELDYDFEKNEFVVYKERYHDKNGKNSIQDGDLLREYILNIYKTILLRGIKGTYVYVCNENLRNYLRSFIPRRTRVEQPMLRVFEDQEPNRIPLYDISAAAGSFSDLQQSSDTLFIEVEEKYASDDYFACKVEGDSMDRVIRPGSICLFRKYHGGTRNGLITLVESTDSIDAEFGSRYTVKEYTSKKVVNEYGWQHVEIELIPRSTNPLHEPIKLVDDETVNLQVIGVFVKVLG